MKLRRWLGIALWLTASLASANPPFSATNLWSVDVGFYSDSSPAMATNGVIYVSSWDGRVFAINPDGNIRWQFRTHLELKSSPAVGPDGTVFVGCRNRKIYALRPDGKVKWEFKTGGWVDASVAIGTDGTVYFGSWDRKFYALTPGGAKKWEFATGAEIESSAVIGANGVIYFGSHDKKFYALNPDGTKRWEYPAGGAVISASPAIAADGTIYFSSVNGSLHAVHPDGTKRWELATGGISGASPVLGPDGTIYLGVNTNYCAIRPDGTWITQRPLWQHRENCLVETAPVVEADGTVVFASCDGFVMAMGGDDLWNWRWNFWLSNTGSSPLAGPDGTIYVLSHYKLYAIKNDVPLSKTSAWPMFRGDPQHTGRARSRP